jgi:hypothetical protein
MGEFSIFHWLIVLAVVVRAVVLIAGIPLLIYYLILLVKKATK